MDRKPLGAAHPGFASLDAELHAISAALQANGIPHSVVGGMAVGLLVEPRVTVDLDFLIHSADWERVKDVLAPQGFHDLSGPIVLRAVTLRRLIKVMGEDLMVADFLIADPPDDEGIRDALQIPTGRLVIPVAPPDVLIRMKRQRMSRVDVGDIAILEAYMRGEAQR